MSEVKVKTRFGNDAEAISEEYSAKNQSEEPVADKGPFINDVI